MGLDNSTRTRAIELGGANLRYDHLLGEIDHS